MAVICPYRWRIFVRKIDLVTTDDLEHRLAVNLMQGVMPDPFLRVGEGGLRNLLASDTTVDLQATESLRNLLDDCLSQLIGSIFHVNSVVSLVSGSGEGERVLLEAAVDFCTPLYVAVNPSSNLVETALANTASVDVEKLGLVALAEDLPLIRSYWEPPVLLCLLGNAFCSYQPDVLFDLVFEQFGPDDLLLLDCCVLSDRALNDQQVDVVCRSRQNMLFHINPLVNRGMEPDAFVFNIESIEQETDVGKVYKVCKWLDITKDSVICCGSLNVRLFAGSRVELGFAYRYTREQVIDFLSRRGFDVVASFSNARKDGLLVLAEKHCN